MIKHLSVTGNLTKLRTTHADPVQYTLEFGQNLIPLNEYIGRKLQIKFLQIIHCLNCNKATKTSFQQGFCFMCAQRLACCDNCIVRPETCHYHLGTCREPHWGQEHCMREHALYLAHTSDLKIGVTRLSQVPYRWIDQGATQAIILATTQNRLLAGLFEHQLKASFKDRTNWRTMLKATEHLDLLPTIHQAKHIIQQLAPATLQQYQQKTNQAANFEFNPELHITHINYPVQVYPDKPISLDLHKNPVIDSTLLGIKGQYLLLEQGVLNVRKFGGYSVELILA